MTVRGYGLGQNENRCQSGDWLDAPYIPGIMVAIARCHQRRMTEQERQPCQMSATW
jgi:hypothetical protein